MTDRPSKSGSQPQVAIRTSPHIHRVQSVEDIMRNVVYALLPVCAYAVYQFGISALALMVVSVAVCLGTESLFCCATKQRSSISDWSVTITALLLALTLPPGFPLWMAAVAAFVGVALGKALFGGLGYNVMNPALVGRAFVQASFPVAITTWTPAFAPGRFTEFIPSTLTLPFTIPPDTADWSRSVVDGFSGATPLALRKFEQVDTANMDLLFGMTSGSAGETSALLILLCGGYLVLRNMMNWRIAAGVLLAAFITSGALFLADSVRYPDPLFMLFSGGLMLGAVFMATDMVASPVTPVGVWVYGALIGFLTIIIRIFGGLPEGMMYALLLANASSPLISAATQPRIYGERRREKKA